MSESTVFEIPDFAKEIESYYFKIPNDTHTYELRSLGLFTVADMSVLAKAEAERDIEKMLELVTDDVKTRKALQKLPMAGFKALFTDWYKTANIDAGE